MAAIVLLHAGHWLPSLLAVLVPLLLVVAVLLVIARAGGRRAP